LRREAGTGRGAGVGRAAVSPGFRIRSHEFRCDPSAPVAWDLSLIGCLIAGLGSPNAVNPLRGFALACAR